MRLIKNGLVKQGRLVSLVFLTCHISTISKNATHNKEDNADNVDNVKSIVSH